MAEAKRGNPVEEAAIAWVLAYEKAQGSRHALPRGAGGHREPPPSTIEVRAFGGSNRSFDLWLETRQLEEARRNPDFYLYVVENVKQGDPTAFTLKVLGGALTGGLAGSGRLDLKRPAE